MKFKRVKRYPGGALGDMSKGIAELQSSLERLKAVPPINLNPNGNSATIEFLGYDHGGGGGESEYASYFRVIDATDEGGAKIGVTNGTVFMLDPVGNCGVVKVSGVRVNVAAASVSVAAAGLYHVWIHSWIDVATGPHSEIIVGDADDDAPPANPNGGIAYASQLAGRVSVVADGEDFVVSFVTQDYLRGGEHAEEVWGDCAGEIVCPDPEE
jgi:hypothetical protein